MLYSRLHNIVEYDTSKNMVLHTKAPHTDHIHMMSHAQVACVFIQWQCPLIFQLEHMLYMNDLFDS